MQKNAISFEHYVFKYNLFLPNLYYQINDNLAKNFNSLYKKAILAIIWFLLLEMLHAPSHVYEILPWEL